MKKEFVTYEQALALKELGFNEECFYYYDDTKELIDFAYFDLDRENSTINSDYGINKVSTAPLYQQAFRFFREKYGLYYYIILSTEKDLNWYYTIYNNGSIVQNSFGFDTYEQAEQACLDKLIEIAKESKQ